MNSTPWTVLEVAGMVATAVGLLFHLVVPYRGIGSLIVSLTCCTGAVMMAFHLSMDKRDGVATFGRLLIVGTLMVAVYALWHWYRNRAPEDTDSGVSVAAGSGRRRFVPRVIRGDRDSN